MTDILPFCPPWGTGIVELSSSSVYRSDEISASLRYKFNVVHNQNRILQNIVTLLL